MTDSRIYKGCYFRWAADECAQPLGTGSSPAAAMAGRGQASTNGHASTSGQPASGQQSASQSASSALNPRANRFEPLSDGDEAP